MQLKTLQIVWHGKEPVLSVDFQPNSHVLVSGGQDGEVKHWEVVSEEDGSPGVRYLSSYPVNSKSVNCVRFSPAGDMLASAGDQGEVLLWRFSAFAPGQQQQQQPRGNLDGADVSGGVAAGAAAGMWRQAGMLRGHGDDVLDLAWAPDGSALISGGVENTCIVWDVEGRREQRRIKDHGHYVQGVAWDPLGRYVASQSADRTARVYAVGPPQPQAPVGTEGGAAARKAAAAAVAAAAVTSSGLAKGMYAAATLAKGPAPQQVQAAQQQQAGPTAAAGEGGGAHGAGAKQPLFSDDSLPTFFRRLAWSPDGAFLAAPAGVFKAAASAPVTSTTHIFSRADWSAPSASLPCLSKGALVVRFCPRLFRAIAPEPPGPGTAEPAAPPAAAAPARLLYRAVLAVASLDSVLLYDMQSLEPLAVLGGIHFAAVTDMAWSDDGRFLVVASRDGYCTVCSFADGELGEAVPLDELPAGVAALVTRAAAKRHQERLAAAAASKASATTAAAAAAAASAGAGVHPGGGTDPQQQQAEQQPPAVASTAAAAAGGARRRIQPIAVGGGGGQQQQPAPGGEAPSSRDDAAPGAAAGSKRAAEGQPGEGGTGGPKSRRIQPIPLSASLLPATAPLSAAAAVPAPAGNTAAMAGAGAQAVGAAGASPGRRRIVPMRIEGAAAPAAAPGGAAGGATASGQQLPAGVSPLPPPACVGAGATGAAVGPMPGAPSLTPEGSCCAMGGSGAAVPESAAKMPTPQVLVFGTPNATVRDNAAAVPASHPQSQQQQLGVTPSLLANSQPPRARRLAPTPVEPRGQAQQPLIGAQQQQLQAAAPAPEAVQLPTAANQGQAASCSAAPGAVAVLPAAALPAAAPAAGAVPGPGGGSGSGAGGGGGGRLSIAQMAAMRGAAAARKAAGGNA